MADLLEFDGLGIYCPAGGFHIDPWRPVRRAVITHAHSDHARPGHAAYLCTEETAPLLRRRLGPVDIQTLPYGETIEHEGVRISFHPAGHIFGSAQVLVEHGGDRWGVSGDYKLEDDGVSRPFEPVSCRVFISECTFGLPIYRWDPQEVVFADVNAWWRSNAADGVPTIFFAYSLGKAQRLLRWLDQSIGPVYAHGAVYEMHQAVLAGGGELPPLRRFSRDVPAAERARACIIAPPAAAGSPWLNAIRNARVASVSGWMALRGVRRRRGVDRGFAVSDHADWPSLERAIRATGAERVIATHGYTEPFARWLAELGLASGTAKTAFEGDDDESPPPASGAGGGEPAAAAEVAEDEGTPADE